jgi:hypothetical protein
MAKGKDILNAALKALLAGAEASAWVKIPATFISEIASLPKDKRDALGKASPEKFDELLAQAELSTTNSALAAVGTEQIKKMIVRLIRLSNEQLNALTEITQKEFERISGKLDVIGVTTNKTYAGVEELRKKFDRFMKDDLKDVLKDAIKEMLIDISNQKDNL